MTDPDGRAAGIVGDPLALACDCHIHINDPRYAYVDAADLRPPPATVQDYRRVQAVLGTRRVVVVQPSSYGTDNRCTLAAVAAFGEDARAVLVIDEHVTDAQLRQWHALGARGVRVNLLRPSPVAASRLDAIARRIAPHGWHLQLHASPDGIVELAATLRQLPVPVVFDHLGRLTHAGGKRHAAFGAIASLLERHRAWMKLSGAELDGARDAPAYAPAAELAAHFIALAPRRMVWGSNWPHPATHKNGEPMPDDAALLRWLSACAPDVHERHAILVTNPAELYDFGT